MRPPKLAEALSKLLLKLSNYVQGRALNHRVFMLLCKQMHTQLRVLYHSQVRWLSQGIMFNCIFKLREKLVFGKLNLSFRKIKS